MGAATNLDTSRLKLGDLVAGISGLVLIISLLLEWYSISAKSAFIDVSQGLSGFEALGFLDLVLFLIGAIAIAVAVLRALNVLPRGLPASPGLIVLGLGALALLITLFRLLVIPDGGASDIAGIDVGRSYGVFVALLASAGVALGGWLGWNEEGKPKPSGAGSGAGTSGAGGPGGPAIGQGQPVGGQPVAQQPVAQQPVAQQPHQEYVQPAATPAAAAPEAQAVPAAAGAAKADWYPDPRGEKRLRYWDGSTWTDHTAD